MNIVKYFSLYGRLPTRNMDARAVATAIVLSIMSFVVLPNLPYLWLGRFAPTRAMINIDYMFLSIISILLNARLVFCIFVFISLVDAFVFISYLYHFTPVEFFLNLAYVRYNPMGFSDVPLAEIGAMAIIVALAAFLASKTAGTRNIAVPLTIAPILCFLVVADVCNGTNTYPIFTHLPFYGRTQYVAVNVANSGLLATDVRSFLPDPHPQVKRASSASQIAYRQWQVLQAGKPAGVNMALILVESWGEFEDRDALNRAIASPLLSQKISGRYRITYGTVPFKGSTTSAELREICGISGSYRDLIRLRKLDCLPKTFNGHGYTSTGMHGFYGDMFDRRTWWTLVGLKDKIFLDDFQKSHRSKKCGSAFPGLCDDILIRKMADKLRDSRQFVYALTINSHLPLPPGESSSGTLDCNKLTVVLHDVRCSLAQHWRKVFDAVARNALRSDIAPTIFVIVGDHSPPLMTSGEQDFSSTQVPYIILTPRQVLDPTA